MSLLKKIGTYFVFILFFICLANLGLTADEVRIKDIVISGNTSVPSEAILKIVDNELSKIYLWITPTDNLLLLRRSAIKNQILDNIKKISSVRIFIHGLNKIEVAVLERESSNLWCKGTPISTKGCYFMDSGGFIFQEAPTFSADAFPKYFGLITDNNPIGQTYFKGNFSAQGGSASGGKNISGLYNGLKNMLFQPKSFNAINENEYEVNILGGGKILINNKKSFESSLTNLQALVDNKYIKTDDAFLKKIKYIDLRFGNKVNFELN